MPIKGVQKALQDINEETVQAEARERASAEEVARERLPQATAVRRHGVRDVPGPNPERTPIGATKNADGKMNRGMEMKRRRMTKLNREMGPIVQLLEDPMVADIWRNNDGSIWVNKIGVGTRRLDYEMSDDTAESLIGTVADSMNATVSATKPIFEGVLPGPDKSRFSASVPPVCNGGFMFCIRKRAVMSRTLDDYLASGSATQEQVALLRKCIRARNNFLIVGATGSGKALPLSAKVLTPDGYVTMGDLKVGDTVIGRSGRAVKVEGVFPQGSRAAWRLHFSDETSTLADDEHLWSVQTRASRSAGRESIVKTTKEMRHDLTYSDGKAKWFIPMVEPIRLKKRPVSFDPYLLGLLLGMKKLNGSDKGVGHLLRAQTAATNASLPFAAPLKKLGLLEIAPEEVFIPHDHLWNSLPARLAIFQGLMDGGAWFQKGTNHVAFATRSRTLADQVVWLVQSFGGTARVGTKATGWRVYIRLPEGISPSRDDDRLEQYKACTYRPPSRSVVKIEPAGRTKMQCIKVDARDSLYVIEHAIVTHNTTFANAILKEMSEGAPPDDRFVILEDTAELQCEAVNRVEALTAPGFNMNDLLRACMRWSPRRICIGELRGPEAADLIKAWNTGHNGGITTIHSETARRALDRLEDLIAESHVAPNKRRIADAIQCIVVIADIGKGVRRIVEIARVTNAVEGDYGLEYLHSRPV